MMNSNKGCGCTEAQVIADARRLGFEQEFQAGTYTCCQITQWAREQWFAWCDAVEEDAKRAYGTNESAEVPENAKGILLPVRLRSRRRSSWLNE